MKVESMGTNALASTMMDSPLSVLSILRHGARVYGDSEVVTCSGIHNPPRRRSFREIADRAAQLAGALRDLGIGPGDRVATFQWNTAEHLEAYLAVPSMGAVLHTLNIRLFPEQISYVIDHAEDEVILVDHSVLGLLTPLLGTVKQSPTIVVVNGPLDEAAPHQALAYEELLAAQPTAFDWPEDVDERAAAGMCYTSGTTGNPKGVVYSHRSTWLHALTATSVNTSAIGERDRVLPIVPMFHANAWGYPYAAWLAGADLLFPSSSMGAEALAWFIHTERPTTSAGVPTIWNDLLHYGDEHELDLSSFRMLFCGGSAVPRALMKGFRERHGLEMVQGWGMTETSPVAATSRAPKGIDEDSDEAWTYRAHTGRLHFGVEARAISEDGEVLRADGTSVGEFEVRGPWVTGSYYRDDDPTRFHDGWLRTGDVGTIDAKGFLQITDRSKDVIKSGGEWISSVDLENTLMAHPDVLEAAVVGVPDPRWEERPLACVVRAPGSSVQPGELHAYLAERVVKWWLPERWAFIDSVPRTSVGKFDKKVLRARYAAGELDVTTLT
jgi:fatty-acyl-CoA synthase